MNKRIFFKLGLVLLSLSLVSCGQKNNSEDNNHEDMHQDIQSNIEQYTQEESTEDEYYTIIIDAWQKQKDYMYVLENGSITTSKVVELLAVKHRRARAVLLNMVEDGYLRKEGAARSTIYVKNTEE